MANFFEEKDRRVLPNLRSFKNTHLLGELDRVTDQPVPQINSLGFNNIKGHWVQNKNLGTAADLISNGLLINKTDPEVVAAAGFILSSKSLASKSQLNIARLLVPSKSQKNKILLPKLSEFIKSNHLPNIYQRIHAIKSSLKQFPENAIAYVELARLYSILGQKEKAISSIKKALYIGRNNRFVLRSATRLCTHFNEFDIPKYFLRKSQIIEYDPWIVSAEIALSEIIGKRSKLIKKGIHLINSDKFNPFSITELSAAIGSILCLEGNKQKSKKLVSKALIHPNDNSLAQVEWLSNRVNFINIEANEFTEVKNKFEAMALNSYYNENWIETINNSEQWFLDMPFSKRPVMLGSFIASTQLNNQNVAIQLCRAGLISHPNDTEISNNLAYSLALNNNITEAQEIIEKINFNDIDDDVNKICLTATIGLIEFKKGNYPAGREQYEDAMAFSKKIKNDNLFWLAKINLLREELNINPALKNEASKILSEMPDDNVHIKFLKQQLIDNHKIIS